MPALVVVTGNVFKPASYVVWLTLPLASRAHVGFPYPSYAARVSGLVPPFSHRMVRVSFPIVGVKFVLAVLQSDTPS